MAMNGTTMGTEIYDALVAGGYIASDEGDAEAIWQEIATAIVAHIQTNDAHTHTDSQGGATSTPIY